jgi:hypothetical protein
MLLQNLSNGLANFNCPEWLLKRIINMYIAINNKTVSMVGVIKVNGLLLIVMSCLLVLAGCSTNSARPIFEPPLLETADVDESAAKSDSKTEVVTIKSSTSVTSEPSPSLKTTSKNKTPKPYAGSTAEKKVYKAPFKKKKVVSQKSLVQKSSVKILNTEKAVIEPVSLDKGTAAKVIVVDKAKSTNKLTKTLNVTAPKYAVDLAKLPLMIGSHWTLRRDDVNNRQCVLSYRSLAMDDGQGETPVFIIVTEDEVLFKTKSNIDMTYKQTGVTIDEHSQMPIEKLYNDFSISYKANYQTLVERMEAGEQVVLTLGFWPSWPITTTRSINVALGEFSAAQQALKTCLKLEKELK